MFKPKFTRSFWFVCAFLCSVLLNCSTFNFDKAQNGQIRRHCVVKCFHSGVETFGRALIDEKISTRQSCFQDCMRKFGNQSSFGNHHTNHLFTRLKREARQSTLDCTKTAEEKYMGINKTYINVKFLNKAGSIFADVSWSRAPESANVTGYKLIYRWHSTIPYLCQYLDKTNTSAEVNISSLVSEGRVGFYLKVITLPLTKSNVPFPLARLRIEIPQQIQPPAPVSQNTTSSTTNFRIKIPHQIQPTAPVSQNTTSSTTHFRVTIPQQIQPTVPLSQNTTSSTGHLAGKIPPSTIVIIVVCVSLIPAIALALGCLYLRYLRLSRSRKQDLGFEFDAFIIYNSADEEWVNKTLRRTLEDKYGLKCCLHYRDFIPGKPFRENMADSVYKSKKTIAVVSHNFFRSKYCSHEMEMALGCSLQRGDNSVIVIKLDDVDKNKLPKALKDRSFIDYGKLIERETWEKKLMDSMRPPSKQKTAEACFV